MQKLKIAVFDDENKREKHYEGFRDAFKFELKFISLEKKDPFEELQKFSKLDFLPDIIIVDHRFSNVDTKITKGSSIISALREFYSCPIVSVTAAFDECTNDFDSNYDDIFDLASLSEIGNYFQILSDGFAKVKAITSLEDLISLIGVPDDVKDDFISSLPNELRIKENYENFNFPSIFYRWFKSKFYKLAGFLYDQTWATTFMGIDSSKFPNYSKQIDRALYKGIWMNPNDKRWWKSCLYDLVLLHAKKAYLGNIQELCYDVFKVNEKHISKCYRCKEKWPEIMAYVDEDIYDTHLKQMHFRCTMKHPHLQSHQYYEEPRVMI